MNTQTNSQQQPLLSHLYETAKEAYRNTSFYPEKRAESIVNGYSEELTKDIEYLTAQGIEIEVINNYQKRYENLLISWLNRKSNTFSVMITGAGNFPIRRHEKANRSESKHYEIFREWRGRAKKAILRKPKEKITYLSEIDRYKSELEAMRKNHELMKEGNKRIAQAKKSGEDITEYLKSTFNILPHMIEWTLKFGFGLQNNNANMKRVEQRIKELEQKEAQRSNGQTAKYTFMQGEFIVNYEADRIQIFFTARPSKDELFQWKEKGLNTYNWSPSANCWQRKITANALSHLKKMIDSKITKI